MSTYIYIGGALVAAFITLREIRWYINMNRRQRKLNDIALRFNTLRGLPPSPELIQKHRDLLREIDDV